MDTNEKIICVNNLTKDYGNNCGLFNVSFEVRKGEVFGFLGPNGAGKTTAMRHLLGFIRPNSGSCSILDMDCFLKPNEIQKNLGYIAGEIALPDTFYGHKLIEQIAKMRKVTTIRAFELCEYFDINPKVKIRRMSKGMKQKIALVLALMHEPDILLLDEPTSGLDPLMQEKFCELILKEKEKGKTILLSSHIFSEIEKTCDRVMIIKHGKIITEVNMKNIEREQPDFIVTKFSLEKYFMNYYKKVD